jgi:hypothetical protein
MLDLANYSRGLTCCCVNERPATRHSSNGDFSTFFWCFICNTVMFVVTLEVLRHRSFPKFACNENQLPLFSPLQLTHAKPRRISNLNVVCVLDL